LEQKFAQRRNARFFNLSVTCGHHCRGGVGEKVSQKYPETFPFGSGRNEDLSAWAITE